LRPKTAARQLADLFFREEIVVTGQKRRLRGALGNAPILRSGSYVLTRFRRRFLS
jgi:hypothetical protein